MPREMAAGTGREYMRKTRYAYLETSDQQRGRPAPPVVETMTEAGVELPPPQELGLSPVDFTALVTRRASLREFARTPLSRAELSFLLWCTQGVKDRFGGAEWRRGRR